MRSRVVMVNEAHNGALRCVRTREVGRRLLPVAHRLGARYLAMEALPNTGQLREWTDQANHTRTVPLPFGKTSYLAQPDMRTMIQAALDLGWTLLAYEAEFDKAPAETDARIEEERKQVDWRMGIAWREQEEAQNLAAHVAVLPSDARLLVWCGWAHLGWDN